ncbi:MAG: DUF2059 domain-containing protein [Pseudomonadota bacterium]
MIKRTIFATTASLALLAGAPLAAQDGSETVESEEFSQDDADAIGAMLGGVFTAVPLTAEQQARLPKSEALMAMMMPEGFYAELMSEMMGSTLEPMMAMISGEGGASLLLGTRLNLDPEEYSSLSGEEKVEIAQMLDPGFSERGRVMQEFLGNIMVDVASDIEPGFRAGMAKAYAVRFNDSQLDDLGAFFATPTGQIFATENMKLMADPQVMSATMEAMPQMMQRFGSLEAAMESAMESVPAERSVDELDAAERARLAELLGVGEGELNDLVAAPTDALGNDDVEEEAS